MAFPWLAAAMFGSGLLDLLFGKKSGQTTTETTQEIPPWTPRDPGYALMSPMVMRTLLQNYGRLSGAGFPGGRGIGQDWTSDILKQLEASWPDIIGAYSKAGSAGQKMSPIRSISSGSLNRGG